MSSRARSVTAQMSGSGCQQANPGQTIGGDPQRPRLQLGRLGSEERNKRMRTSTGVGMSHSILRPACACRRCRARRARCTPRIVESTLITEQPLTAGWKQRSWQTESQHARHPWDGSVAHKLQSNLPGLCLRNAFVFSFMRHTGRPQVARILWLRVRARWGLMSAGLLLVLLLFTGMGMFWDLGPLAPLLFRPTATVTIVPTRLDSQATLLITAVTGTPDPARHEVAARFVSATTPASEAFGQASGVTHVPAVAAGGTLTFYNAATYPQTIAAGTVLTGADGVQVVTDAAAPIPAGNPPLVGVITVNAHTALAGARGNIAALDIDGLCCVAGVAVKNTAGFSGGQDAQTYPTVRQADIDGLARPLLEHADAGCTDGGTGTASPTRVDGDPPCLCQRSQRRPPCWKQSDTGDGDCCCDLSHRGIRPAGCSATRCEFPHVGNEHRTRGELRTGGSGDNDTRRCERDRYEAGDARTLHRG